MNTTLKICLGAAALFCGFSARSQVNARPSILFLFADDQRADALGCAGNPYIRTPHIDRLAKSGVRFTNGYVMGGHHGAICAPSRAMLLSGKSLFHVYDKLDGVETMPAYFAKHGYETFGTGKWHNGKSAFEASFQQGKNVMLGGMSDHYNVP
ncbi:MAG TPA: sulfatase-like hydrolase/transferase, partial [Prolixibacteraceae bacterium]|nr:sulfatase-like hydrolase/transferase [Prolixibacteraceae bacterium]